MIYAATIFLSSFLLFLVQPLIARLILPWFGGSAAVWTTCMLFFQVLLLAGYAYAHVLGKLAGRRQAIVHSVLLLAALATLPVMPAESWKPAGERGGGRRAHNEARLRMVARPFGDRVGAAAFGHQSFDAERGVGAAPLARAAHPVPRDLHRRVRGEGLVPAALPLAAPARRAHR